MKKSDQVKILVEIMPPCSCSSYNRGDEIMTCGAHGIEGYRQPSETKIMKGVVLEEPYQATDFCPPTVHIDIPEIKVRAFFDCNTGRLFILNNRLPYNVKVISLVMPARLDNDREHPCEPLTKITTTDNKEIVSHKEYVSDLYKIDHTSLTTHELKWEDTSGQSIQLNNQIFPHKVEPMWKCGCRIEKSPPKKKSWFERLIQHIFGA